MKWILGFIGFIVINTASAQSGNGYRFGNVEGGAMFTLGTDFNYQDATISGRIGFFDKFNLWGVGAEFGMRPFRKNIEIKESENLFIQYREIRTVIGLYAEKQILPIELRNGMKMGFLVGSSFGGQHANFAGISDGEWNLWIAPYAGFIVNFKEDLFVNFGYKYENVQNDLLPHKLFISLAGIL